MTFPLGQTLPVSEAPGTPAQDSAGPGATSIDLICGTGRGGGQVSLQPDHPPKLPLLSHQSPRSVPGAAGDAFVANSGPVQAPKQPSAVIAGKIKQTFSKREKISSSVLKSALSPCSDQSLEPIQPLATRAEAWQAIPGVSKWVLWIIKRGYSLQFA